MSRLVEALDPETPLARQAIGYCDPRAIVRDLTTAIAAHDNAPSKFTWPLLSARIVRVQALLRFDIAFRRHFGAEASALQASLGSRPPGFKNSDWPAVRVQARQDAVALRRKLMAPNAGYRDHLANAVASACVTGVASATAMRRLDERVGLLAQMLLDEGQDRERIIERVADAMTAPEGSRFSRVRSALWAGGHSYEVLVAAVGVEPWPTHDPAIRVHRVRRVPRLAGVWPFAVLARFIVATLASGGDRVISVRVKARDHHHAVRLARVQARHVCAHQATAALARRARVLEVSLVRRRAPGGREQLVRAPRPDQHIPAPEPHPLTLAAPSLAYAGRAAAAESDVSRVLDSWIGIEALFAGRPGNRADMATVQLPDLVWVLAARAVFVDPLNALLGSGRSSAVAAVANWIGTGGAVDEALWLDVLEGKAPAAVLTAFSELHADSDPLLNWKVQEAQALLLNGPLLARRLDRHRTHAEFLMRRLRESRNAIVHGAWDDVAWVTAKRAIDSNVAAPVDARVLGGVGVAMLADFGKVAAQRLTGSAGQPSSPELLLASASHQHEKLRKRLVAQKAGQRVFAKPPTPP